LLSQSQYKHKVYTFTLDARKIPVSRSPAILLSISLCDVRSNQNFQSKLSPTVVKKVSCRYFQMCKFFVIVLRVT